jgi:predicted transcriptional regulator
VSLRDGEPKGGSRATKRYGESLNRRLELTGLVYIAARKWENLTMPDDQSTTSVDRALAAKVIAAYVGRNRIPADQFPSLIATVYQALARLGNPTAEPAGERTPAVPIRRSVTRDFVVCLECGWKGAMLRRHLTTAHSLTVDAYRARWNLSRIHAMTAPAYSERRSTVAKQIGLGRGVRRTLKRPAPESPAAAPRRRGRPRSKATPTAPV